MRPCANVVHMYMRILLQGKEKKSKSKAASAKGKDGTDE